MPFSPFGPGVRFSASNFASSSANLASETYDLQYSIKGYAALHEARHFLTNELLAHRSGYHILHLLVSSARARAQSVGGGVVPVGGRGGGARGVLQHVASFLGLHGIASSSLLPFSLLPFSLFSSFESPFEA